MKPRYGDLTGKIINGIKVIAYVEGSGGGGKAREWVCECQSCKKEFISRQDHLFKKKTPNCSECVKTRREDLSGQKFGYLTVDYMIYPGKYKRTLCSCTCDCGASNIIVQANHLKFGETKSCGCLKSYPEEQIAILLTENNIPFEREKRFEDLIYKNHLRFDFYLPELDLVIEYNGEQHYIPIEHYGGYDDYLIRRERDMIKEQYCLDNNIKYLVIRYDENIEETLITNNIIMKR